MRGRELDLEEESQTGILETRESETGVDKGKTREEKEKNTDPSSSCAMLDGRI